MAVVKPSAASASRPLVFDLSRSGSQLLTVETIRMAFLAIVLLITVFYQLINSAFISFDIFFSVYLLLALSFLVNCVYIIRMDRVLKSWFWTASLFVWETIYVSFLIYFIGISQSLLMFLYLINILLCGVVFQRRGGIYLALVTSVAFSLLLALDKNVQGNTLFLTVGINNLAFFTVAYLSGYLSEQLNFMGTELLERGRDISVLKNLNSLIINNMEAGLLTVDPQGQVLQENAKALDILGERGSVLGQNLRQLCAEIHELSGEGRVAEEVSIYVHNEKKVLRCHVSPLKDESGEQQGTIIVFEDVTHLKKLEHRVLQSEKMAAIGQLAAGIAHEIRNPLASISGSVQLLKSDSVRTPEEQKLMGIVIKEIDRLNHLITEFLDYARPQNLQLTSFNLSEFLKELVETLKFDQNIKDAEIIVEAEPRLFIRGQSDKLKQAFWNILLNGLQAMEGRAEKKMSVRAYQTGSQVIVSVRDSGAGISSQNIKKIFEPFHTTKAKGTGLGLAVVHSILEGHGAQIEVKSEVGRGTEFMISFQANT